VDARQKAILIIGLALIGVILLTIPEVRKFLGKTTLILLVISFPFLWILSSLKYGAWGYFGFVAIIILFQVFNKK
jgi:hypothetical protein